MSKSNLKREIALLKEKNGAVMEVVDALQHVNTVLKETNSSLEKRNSALEEETSKLQLEKALLLERTSDLENEASSSHDLFSGLMEQILALIVEISGLDKRICQLQCEKVLLLERTSALEIKASGWQQVSSDLKEKILALEENASTWKQNKARMEEVTVTLEGEASIWHQEKILLEKEISSPENEVSMSMQEEAGQQGGNSPHERKPLFERRSLHLSNNLTLMNGAKTGSSSLLPSSSGYLDQNDVKQETNYIKREVAVSDCPLCKHMSQEFGIPQKSTIHLSQTKNPKKSVLTETCHHIIGLNIQARSDLLSQHAFCRVCLFKPITEDHKEENCKFLVRRQKLKCKYCFLRSSVCTEHKQDNLSNLELSKETFSKYGFDFQF